MDVDIALPPPDMAIDTRGEESECRLIDQARQDPEAFARLYRLHYPRMAGYIHRRTGQREVAEDLVGDVFLTALKNLPRYRHGEAPFRAWLYRIASNAVNQWARRERRRLRREQGHAMPADGASLDSPDGHIVRRALLSIDPKQQDILILHHLEGLGIEQIALVLGRPAGTIKSRLHRAREALRRVLADARGKDHT